MYVQKKIMCQLIKGLVISKVTIKMSIEQKQFLVNDVPHNVHVYVETCPIIDANTKRLSNSDKMSSVEWFKANELARTFQFKATDNAIRSHVNNLNRRSWSKFKRVQAKPHNWQPKTVMITEAGVYELLWFSKSPTGRRFRYWITNDVLPSISRQGAYIYPHLRSKNLLNLLGRAHKNANIESGDATILPTNLRVYDIDNFFSSSG